jgi:5-methylcytosine-specific restriction endonuclease McrA
VRCPDCKAKASATRKEKNRVKNAKRNSLKVIEWRRSLKIKAVEYKGGKCSRCGYCKSLRALQFHHRDPKQKDFAISRPNPRSWEKVKVELDKCDLLCANCHSEAHDELYSAGM